MCLHSVPSGPPFNLSVVVGNSTHATLVWNDPNPAEQNGVIVEYRVKLFGTDSLDTYPQLTVFSPSIMLSDLHPYYTYQAQVAAATSVGIGPYSILHTFRMDEAGMCAPSIRYLVIIST